MGHPAHVHGLFLRAGHGVVMAGRRRRRGRLQHSTASCGGRGRRERRRVDDITLRGGVEVGPKRLGCLDGERVQDVRGR